MRTTIELKTRESGTDVLIDFQRNDEKATQWFLQELRAGRLARNSDNRGNRDPI